MFEKATRQALRFPSNRGLLTTEQLWELPLQSKTGLDLNNVAKSVNTELKGATEEDFVNTRANPEKTRLELMMEIVKHIIATKQAENEAQRTTAEKRAKRQQLLEIMAEKQNEGLKGLSVEDLQKQIDALS